MAEKATQVRSPLMVLASLPRKISPSEKVTIPVTLFATEKNIKNVTLQIKTNNAVRVVGSSSQLVKFTEPDEKMAYFNLNVGSVTGLGKVQIIATSGKEKSTYDVEIESYSIFEFRLLHFSESSVCEKYPNPSHHLKKVAEKLPMSFVRHNHEDIELNNPIFD